MGKWRDVVICAVMALVSAGAALTAESVVGRAAGWFGIVFFGIGALALAIVATGRTVPLGSRPSGTPVVAATSRTASPIEVSGETRLVIEQICDTLRSYGILDPSISATLLYEAAADNAGPGRQVWVDDVLAGLDEIDHYHGEVDLTATRRNVRTVSLDRDQLADDIVDDITRLSGMGPEPLDVSFPEVSNDPLLVRAVIDGQHVEVAGVPGSPGPPVFAHVAAIAELHAQRWPGYRLATLIRDETVFVVRLAGNALDECNRELGIESGHYTRLEWIEHPADPELGRATIGPNE